MFQQRFDPQVNGAGGVSYTDQGLTLEQANKIADTFRRRGTDNQLATLVTTEKSQFLDNLRVVAQMCEQREDVRGIHLEGPFISPTTKDAHPKGFVETPSIPLMKELLEAGGGHVALVTLDPSRPGAHDLIKFLGQQGVTVSIGHTTASQSQFYDAIDAGATALTHVPNVWDRSSDARQEKEDFVPEIASDERVYPMMITDRRHNSPDFVRHVWAYAEGELEDRLVIVSDASPLFDLPKGEYRTFDGNPFRVLDPGEVVHEPNFPKTPNDGHPMTWPFSGSMHSLEDCVQTFAEDTRIYDKDALARVGGLNAFEMLRVPLIRSGKFPEDLKERE